MLDNLTKMANNFVTPKNIFKWIILWHFTRSSIEYSRYLHKPGHPCQSTTTQDMYVQDICLCKLKTPSSSPMLASLASTPPLQERDHTSELGTLIPQSTCKLGRKFENSPRSESNAAKFLGDEHIGGQPLTTLWTAKERLCQNFFLKLAAAFVLNNLSQSASKGSLIGESFLFKNKMYFWDAFSHRDVFM